MDERLPLAEAPDPGDAHPRRLRGSKGALHVVVRQETDRERGDLQRFTIDGDGHATWATSLSVLAATDGYEDAVAMVPVGSRLVIARPGRRPRRRLAGRPGRRAGRDDVIAA
jgi:hypothetical protein